MTTTTTRTQHTPGDWTVDTDNVADIATQAHQLTANIGTECEWIAVGIADADGFAEVVALCHPANARLIAAAPYLLAALQQIEDEINRMGSPSLDGWDKARQAIARAVVAEAKATQ